MNPAAVTTDFCFVRGDTGQLLAVMRGVSVAAALEQAEHTLANAAAIADLVPTAQEGVARESLAYACAELIQKASALVTACRESMEGDDQ